MSKVVTSQGKVTVHKSSMVSKWIVKDCNGEGHKLIRHLHLHRREFNSIPAYFYDLKNRSSSPRVGGVCPCSSRVVSDSLLFQERALMIHPTASPMAAKPLGQREVRVIGCCCCCCDDMFLFRKRQVFSKKDLYRDTRSVVRFHQEPISKVTRTKPTYLYIFFIAAGPLDRCQSHLRSSFIAEKS